MNKMKNDNYFLKTEPVGRLLIKLGLPMMFSMLINSLYNIIDSIYVSRLGTDAVTALSIIFPLQNLTVAISVGLGVGVNSVIARFMGADKNIEANRAATTGMILATFHYFLFLIVAVFFLKAYIDLYALPGTQTYQWGMEYGKIVLGFSLPYLYFLIFEKLFQSLGWMKTAMSVMIFGALTNILLDPIMIFGYFGFPALGVSGAAIATVIGQTASFLAFLLIYIFSHYPVRITLKEFRFSFGLVYDIYNVAIPAAVTLALPSFLVGILNTLLVTFSEVSVAVLGLYYKVQTFFYMPISGLIQGMRPLLSYNYGAHEYKRVRRTAKLSFIICMIILGIGFLILQIIPGKIMELFAPEPQLYQVGITAFKIISYGFIFSAIPVVCNGIFEALGLGISSLVVSLLRQLIIMIPTAYIFSSLFGLNGVWWAFPFSEILTAVISLIMLRSAFVRLGINE